MKRVVSFFIDSRLLTNWLMILIIAAGTFGLINLQRRIWPRIEFDYISVNIGWPGASAQEVEEGLILPLEQRLQGLEGIVTITSSAGDNGAWIGLQTSPWYPMQKLMNEVRDAVEGMNDYPEEADRPRITREAEWNRVMLLFIYGPEELSLLESAADEFREELERSGSVTQIRYWGFPGETILIEPSIRRLEAYGLGMEELEQAVRSSSIDLSAGSLLTEDGEIQIRSFGKRTEIAELEEIALRRNGDGGLVRLADVAEIRRGRSENAVYTRANGRPAVGLHIMYSNNEDVIAISKETDRVIEEFERRYQGLVTFKPYIRDVDELHERLGTLSWSGVGGLILVVLVLGFFLSARLSFWVALGIPISFMGLLFLEWVMGITINEMSLFGMIMIIGILVDDGIVIGESIYDQWHRLGKSRRQAAIDGTMEVIAPVTVSIATTVVAFAPYFFIYGDMGKYVRQIGIVVIASLLFSLIEALILLPAHLAHSRALSEEARSPGRLRGTLMRLQSRLVDGIYAPFLDFALKNRALVFSLTAAAIIICAGAAAGNHLKAAFFPEIESPYVYLEVEFPAGSSAGTIDSVRTRLEERAMSFGADWSERRGLERNTVVDFLSWGNSSNLWVYLILIENDARDFTVNEFSRAFGRELPQIPEAESVIVGEDSFFGGDPISFRFLGRDTAAIETAAERFKERLALLPGVRDIRDDTPLGDRQILLSLNPRGEALGLSTASAAGQIRRAFYGDELFSFQEGRRRVPVVLRLSPQERDSLGRLEEFPVVTPAGGTIALKEVADLSLSRGVERIRRENGYRSIRVMAGFDTDSAELAPVLKEINGVILPEILAGVEGVSLSKAGQAEEVDRMIRSMVFSMVLALLIMFTLLLFQMRSWTEALLVLSLIPLGFLGAIYGHIVMRQPLSFISFLGSVALAGIIVNDSVVLIDCFNKKLRSGVVRRQAVREAALQRFRPILMTTLTTAIGLSPLIFGRSVGGQMLIPIGISIAWGLVFGTFLTLAVLPAALSFGPEGREVAPSVGAVSRSRRDDPLLPSPAEEERD